jgi:hypothetical protein
MCLCTYKKLILVEGRVMTKFERLLVAARKWLRLWFGSIVAAGAAYVIHIEPDNGRRER